MTTALTPRRGTAVIVLTFLIAIVLAVMPLPEWARLYRPPWVTLVLIYWALALPQRVGVGVGFVLGILLDTLTGTLLGQHALPLSLVAYITLKTHQRVRLFPLWQQAVFVLGLLVIERLLRMAAMGASGRDTPGSEFWLAAVAGALLWPWAYFVLRDLRRRFRVS
jgi:rod shape-determining protein MreD